MTSMLTQFLSFDNHHGHLQQFRRQLEKLSEQRKSQKNGKLFDEHQFLQNCTDLRKQMDKYKRKIEGMKSMSEQHLKENAFKDLEELTDQLSELMSSGRTSMSLENDSMKMFPSKRIREEKAQVGEINNEKEEISSTDSSSDRDYASDYSTMQEGNRTNDMNLRKDGQWLAENTNDDQGFLSKELTYSEEEAKESDKPLSIPRRTVIAKTMASIFPTSSNKGVAEKSETSEKKKQRDNLNVADMAAPTGTSNIGHNIETKILEESSSEHSKVSRQDLELSEQETVKTTLPKSSSQPITALDTLEKASNYGDHLTYKCYLAPRLSKSNYAFHDIYWNYEDDRLRKRRVRVSKMIKVIRLDKVRLDAIDVHCRLVRAYLFDLKSTEEEYQIVSNVYTIKAHTRTRHPQTWTFSTTKDMQKISLSYPSFIVRSNYKQKSVMLCLEAAIVFTDHEGEMSEQSLGCAMLSIIDENGHCCMKNKNYTAKLFNRNPFNKKEAILANTQIQITFGVSDVPNNIVHQVDSLPDIFLCHELFLPMFFYYRRLLGQFLTKDCDNCSSSALKAEPFLATFPAIADQPDTMEMLWQLWKIHKKNLSEMEEAERFRSFFLTTGFLLHQTVDMPKFNWADARCFTDRQAKLSYFREQYLHSFDAIKYLSRERCHPINIYSYALDIIGPHAII
uniref:Bm5118, isoform c n=1 Tax=Brugia malayi TaxID=6279 RepID=A0A8L7T8A7_BRUMA